MPATAELPKPLLEIGGQPVLRHVMDIYARQGFTDFVLGTGYKGALIADWATTVPGTWSVQCLDTGLDTDTGDRLRACAAVIDDGAFFATYGDGLGNVDLHALRARHADHAGRATVTVVPLPSQYGTLDIDDGDRVIAFREKPVLPEHRINAGFFLFDAGVVRATTGASLERDILPALAAGAELYVYRHEGFWKSMDTHKDVAELDELARREEPPWLDMRSTARASSSPEPPGSSGPT